MDKANARPIAFAMVDIVGTQLGSQADLDGRYRITNVPVGMHRVRARRLGFQPAVIDSVRVTEGEATIQNFAMASAAAQIAAVQTTAVAATRASDAAMLAEQRAAPSVSDGISAQAMARAPGANAADAITRVTGVSIVDKKFTVVRGLPERYNNTMLNGVELPSPEPLRKIVPLDIFPSSLLESIVASKTATPDKPGDFSGGSVEIRTKEFPENRVIQGSISQDWNSLATLQRVSYVPHRGLDWLGFGGSDRSMPPRLSPGAQGDELERFAENMRNVWAPTPRRAPPGLGFGLSIGDRIRNLGYTVALTYSSKVDFLPDKMYQFLSDNRFGVAERGYVARESNSTVDWGATANVSLLAGSSNKIGLKNLYTRNAEEVITQSQAFETTRQDPGRLRSYQVRYVERELLQTQLTGDHALILNSRLEWKATYAQAARDEPDNRSATYLEDINTGNYYLQTSIQGQIWFRFLEDRVLSGNADWSLPVPIWGGREALFKTGGMYRDKQRDFDASLFAYRPALAPPSGAAVFGLPPEEAFSPEHVGTFPTSDIALFKLDAFALPYHAKDNLAAGYGMLDLPLFSWFRIVAGARAEKWMLDVNPKTGQVAFDSITQRRDLDILPSVNLTVSLTDRINLRLAGYQTVARPDPRELSNDYYTPVTGECSNQGNNQLLRTQVDNADVRLEFYPSGSELFALSGFIKRFARPVIETVNQPQATTCVVQYMNGESAQTYGGELEMRSSLAFLPLVPEGVAGSLNFTIVETEAKLGELFQDEKVPFMGQSPYVVNANLSYTGFGDRLTATLLGNAYGDRIVRYGATSLSSTGLLQIPHVYEQKRSTIDAKVSMRATNRVTISLSGRNLGDSAQRFYQGSAQGRVQTGFMRPGVTVKAGAGVEF